MSGGGVPYFNFVPIKWLERPPLVKVTGGQLLTLMVRKLFLIWFFGCLAAKLPWVWLTPHVSHAKWKVRRQSCRRRGGSVCVQPHHMEETNVSNKSADNNNSKVQTLLGFRWRVYCKGWGFPSSLTIVYLLCLYNLIFLAPFVAKVFTSLLYVFLRWLEWDGDADIFFCWRCIIVSRFIAFLHVTSLFVGPFLEQRAHTHTSYKRMFYLRIVSLVFIATYDICPNIW